MTIATDLAAIRYLRPDLIETGDYYATAGVIVSPNKATLPTREEIDAAIASPEFAVWLAEHGGNAAATLRREAREMLSATRAESALHRASLLVVVDELNRHGEKFVALRNAIANANSLAEVRAAVAAIDPVPTRTGQDLRNAAENKLSTGAADS